MKKCTWTWHMYFSACARPFPTSSSQTSWTWRWWTPFCSGQTSNPRGGYSLTFSAEFSSRTSTKSLSMMSSVHSLSISTKIRRTNLITKISLSFFQRIQIEAKFVSQLIITRDTSSTSRVLVTLKTGSIGGLMHCNCTRSPRENFNRFFTTTQFISRLKITKHPKSNHTTWLVYRTLHWI